QTVFALMRRCPTTSARRAEPGLGRPLGIDSRCSLSLRSLPGNINQSDRVRPSNSTHRPCDKALAGRHLPPDAAFRRHARPATPLPCRRQPSPLPSHRRLSSSDIPSILLLVLFVPGPWSLVSVFPGSAA